MQAMAQTNCQVNVRVTNHVWPARTPLPDYTK
jgi:hypothetical protein